MPLVFCVWLRVWFDVHQEPVMPLKQEEELEAEALKEYEQFLALEKVILKNMGLLTEPEDRSDL